mmetsp:Transcript_25050/g.82557  ORF Transcript_25050/g.82557 Transcript_25050/m.82557 type:complete len:207 (+) Transcript_25050:120-740(+)
MPQPAWTQRRISWMVPDGKRGACRHPGSKSRVKRVTWAFSDADCRRACAQLLLCFAYEYAKLGRFSKCHLQLEPTDSTYPILGHSCFAKTWDGHAAIMAFPPFLSPNPPPRPPSPPPTPRGWGAPSTPSTRRCSCWKRTRRPRYAPSGSRLRRPSAASCPRRRQSRGSAGCRPSEPSASERRSAVGVAAARRRLLPPSGRQARRRL